MNLRAGAICLLMTAVVLASGDPMPAAADSLRYAAFVACGQGPSHQCFSEGPKPYAVFGDRERDETRYRICVWDRSRRHKLLCETRTARREAASRVDLSGLGTGTFYVKWRVGKKWVRAWSYALIPPESS
jgi:hypothetical protein